MVLPRLIIVLICGLIVLSCVSAQTYPHAIAVNKKFLKMGKKIPNGNYAIYSVYRRQFVKFTSTGNILSYSTLKTPSKPDIWHLFQFENRGTPNYTIAHENLSRHKKCLSASWYGADNTVMAYQCDPQFQKRDEFAFDELAEEETAQSDLHKRTLTPAKQLWLFIPVPNKPGLFIIMGTVHMFNQWPVCLYPAISQKVGLASKFCPKTLFSDSHFFWTLTRH